ncbi:MAG TPA: hypothetical protein VKY57_09545 [Chitinispirillaceae bacterium]|nr:hypothetical protein [Chitinispirillaceae bacterium]
MRFFKPPGFLRPGGILFLVFIVGIISIINAEPRIKVNCSCSQEQFTITLTGTQINQIQGLEFLFVYDTAYVSIFKSVLSSPLPGTALSVSVDEEAFTLSVEVQAVAVVNVENGDPVFKVSFYPEKQGYVSVYDCLNLTQAFVIDKNGSHIEAVIDTGNSGVKRFLVEKRTGVYRKNNGCSLFQLNGRCLSNKSLRLKSNLYLSKSYGSIEKRLAFNNR